MPSTSPLDKSLVIRLKSPDRLQQHIDLLHTTLAEMRAVNLNNTPLQWHTKLRWEEHLEQALVFFHQMLPAKEI